MFITRSDNPSAKFRQILMPAMACSARTRRRASLRLVRFSSGLNARVLGFYRRQMLPHLWRIAQKSEIAAERGALRITDLGSEMLPQCLVTRYIIT